MAVLQTTAKGRAFKGLAFMSSCFRFRTEEKQSSTCAKVAEGTKPHTHAPDAPGEGAAPPCLPHPPGGRSSARHFRWMAQHAPGFRVRGEDVEVLPSPAVFYDTLKEEASKAKRRIVLSSLYLGTGELEQQFVDELHSAQKANPDLKISILLDYTRGSRGKKKNSRTLLLPLLQEAENRTHVALYHTPELRGFRKWLLPEKFNETIGVQHMKVYLFDDNLIISGANLSESYFTNRQDRYVVLRDCGPLADYCERIVGAVASASFQLQPDDSIQMRNSMKAHPFKDKDNGEAYIREFASRVNPVINPSNWTSGYFRPDPDTQSDSTTPSTTIEPTESCDTASTSYHDDPEAYSGCYDTVVYPLVQMSPFRTHVDEHVTRRLWRDAAEDSRIFLASGYFNLPTLYENVILKEALAVFNILTAHPTANGFLGASFPAGSIPSVYTQVIGQFYQQTRDLVQRHRVFVSEFTRPGWTFHGKGLWYYLPAHTRPALTLVGSPNFGHRSVYRDLELQFAVVTENPQLQDQLHKEQEYMFKRGVPVTRDTFLQPDRRVPYWVQWFTYFCRSFF